MAGKKTGKPHLAPVSFRIDPELKKVFEDLEETSFGIKKSKLMADCLKLGLEQLFRERPEMKEALPNYEGKLKSFFEEAYTHHEPKKKNHGR